jgi:hypothetical protein
MKGTHNDAITDQVSRPGAVPSQRPEFSFSSSSSSKSFGSVSDNGANAIEPVNPLKSSMNNLGQNSGQNNGQNNGMCQQNGQIVNSTHPVSTSMHMLTPQSNCSSGYPSPTIRKENMLPFHMTPLLQSL